MKMKKRIVVFLIAFLVVVITHANAQLNPWLYWTLLPQEQMDEIVGESSGETAWNTIMETGGYNKDRLSDEYASTFYESQYIYDQLKLYGIPGAEIVRFPGQEVWDGIKGELWEVSPGRRKLASYRDMTFMLAPGSNSADVKADLVWIGRGTKEEIDRADVSGKIVVTDGDISSVHRSACLEKEAEGVVAIAYAKRPFFDALQIPWEELAEGGQTAGETHTFGFFIPAREGHYLKQRLLNGENIRVHAQVESKMEPYELQDVICHIPGTDPDAGEVIFVAHLFEGIIKQGANDNKSGSAGLLEMARVLHLLIEEGRLPRPKRTIRFLWGPEHEGTGPWVKENKELMKNILCHINLDMVGEWLSKNQAFMTLITATHGNTHYVNDVMENYYRYVGEGNREQFLAPSVYRVPRRIVAPTGADEPFYWRIEPYSGGSDHEVFNDWGVQVPGTFMCAWPDPWYHTSGDRIDKADPTQMKRTVAIGAATAYTIANADDHMAMKIAGEVTSNGTRRLGHQFVVGLEQLNSATDSTLAGAYKMARVYIDVAVDKEIATLEGIIELADDVKLVRDYIKTSKKTIQEIGKLHLKALEKHMIITANNLNCKPVQVEFTSLEMKATKMVPKQTAKVKLNGHQGYREFINQVPEEEKDKYPYSRRDIADTDELQSLINGKRSVLEIKNSLDVQNPRKSNLQSVINYIEILRLAGLVEM